MAKPVQALISAIEEFEAEEEAASPMSDVVLLGIPMQTYKAMSDAAAARNLTIPQLLSKAFDAALREE